MRGLTGAFLAVTILSTALARAADELKVLSDRTEATVRPLLNEFEKSSGMKVNAVFLEQGLLERLTSRPDEADVVITKDAELLELARTKGLLQPFQSALIEKSIPASFRDPKNEFFVDAYRVRMIIFSKTRVKPSEISTYENLATPRWKGKLCIRSGYHDYNLSLFSQMVSSFGLPKTKEVIKGYHENLAREPKGGDRDQAKGIMEGKCDVGVMNSYYFPIMMGNPEQRPWAEAIGVAFPDQSSKGAFIMRSALALTKSKSRVKAATSLLEFFASETGQKLIVNLTYQYPTNSTVPANESLKAGKLNFVALPDFAKNRETVVKLLNEVNFDNH